MEKWAGAGVMYLALGGTMDLGLPGVEAGSPIYVGPEAFSLILSLKKLS